MFWKLLYLQIKHNFIFPRVWRIMTNFDRIYMAACHGFAGSYEGIPYRTKILCAKGLSDKVSFNRTLSWKYISINHRIGVSSGTKVFFGPLQEPWSIKVDKKENIWLVREQCGSENSMYRVQVRLISALEYKIHYKMFGYLGSSIEIWVRSSTTLCQ